MKKVSPFSALLLSSFVLPGLGQILSNNFKKGLIMMLFSILWIPIITIKIVYDLSEILPLLTDTIQQPDFFIITTILSNKTSCLFLFIIPFLLVWLWSFLDALFHLFKVKTYSVDNR